MLQAPIKSLAYVFQVSTRAMIFIKAKNLDIGLMCSWAVGMCEFGLCDITAYEGRRVKQGG